jgi:hypothetical protein
VYHCWEWDYAASNISSPSLKKIRKYFSSASAVKNEKLFRYLFRMDCYRFYSLKFDNNTQNSQKNLKLNLNHEHDVCKDQNRWRWIYKCWNLGKFFFPSLPGLSHFPLFLSLAILSRGLLFIKEISFPSKKKHTKKRKFHSLEKFRVRNLKIV